jgi:DNA-directed RNA polymerase specialized sigma24 family protein
VVRTALNVNVSRWRRHRREVPIPDLGVVAGQPEAVTGVQDPIDPRIMAALMRLPARQRQVIALRVILDLDTSGTARVLGVRPNTVMVHMVRALATLRSDLGFVLEPQQENQ